MKKTVVKIIQIYQKTLSPDHSFWAKHRFPHGYCRFHPTCSEYTKRSVQRFGVMRGVFLGIWRVIRCNPWNKGGLDPVNNSNDSKQIRMI